MPPLSIFDDATALYNSKPATFEMRRLSIEIDAEQHRQIKALATFSGLTIKDYVLKRILPSKSDKQDTTEYLLSTPANAQRLLDAINAPLSECLVFDTLEDAEKAARKAAQS